MLLTTIKSYTMSLYKSTLLCNILYNLTILYISKIIHYLVFLKLYFIVKWLPKVLQIYLHSSINEQNYNNISEHLFRKLSEKTIWNNKESNKKDENILKSLAQEILIFFSKCQCYLRKTFWRIYDRLISI